MRRSTLCIVAMTLLSALPVAATAETWSGDVTIRDVRTYSDGSLVVVFSPALPAGCQYNDHAQMQPSSPAYKLTSAMVLTAFATQRRVRIIYDGCIGNVNMTGILMFQ